MAERQYNKGSWSADNIIRLKELMNQGCRVLDEIEALREGLSETIKAVAEEMEVKPSQLSKALKVVHKQSFGEEQDKFDEISDILDAAGKK
jgi:hypothetical protein